LPLKKLILKLKQANCITPMDKKNVDINIKVCEMQLEIIEKNKRNKLK